MNESVSTSRFGYTERPQAGRKIFIFTVILGCFVGLGPWLLRLFMGADWCNQQWQEASHTSALLLINMVHVAGGMTIVWWHSITVKGFKRALVSFICVMSVAYFAEYAGTHWGWVFGPYHYTDKIHFHIFGVPLIVAPAWEILLYPSFYLGLYLLPSEFLGKPKSLIQTLVIGTLVAATGALILTLTDLLTDPIWIGHGLWLFHVNGPYVPYLHGGEPGSNFVGWFITGFVIMVIYQLVVFTTPRTRHTRSKYLDVYIPLTMYAFTFAYDFAAMIFFAKYMEIAMIGAFGFGGILLILCTKFYFEKQGFQANLMAQRIIQESQASLAGAETVTNTNASPPA